MKTAMQQLVEHIEFLIQRNTNTYVKASLKDIKFDIENIFLES